MIYNYNFSNYISQCTIFNTMPFICENNKEYHFIIINPECDLVIQKNRNNPKAKYLHFLAIKDFDEVLNIILSSLRITRKQRKGEEYIDKKTYDDFTLILNKFINGDIFYRYFYLPPLKDYFNHSVIDFQMIEIKKHTQEFYKFLKNRRIAQINSSWKESIPTRYSMYYSRVGVEDISKDLIDCIIQDCNIDFVLSS